MPVSLTADAHEVYMEYIAIFVPSRDERTVMFCDPDPVLNF